MTGQDLLPVDLQVDVWAVVMSGIDETLALIENISGDTAWLVHQSRKAGKRWRSYLRLVEGEGQAAARRANRMIRDACRGLSTARDKAARLECLTLLEAATHHGGAQQDIAKLRGLLADHHSSDDEVVLLRQFAAEIQNIRLYLARLPTEQGYVFLGQRLARSTAQVVKAWRRATGSADPETFHEWRKRVQRLKFQLRLPDAHARPERPERPERLDRLDRLSDCLGEIHDLDILADFLETFDQERHQRRYQRVLDAVEQYRGSLQAEAFSIASRIFAAD